MKKKIIIFSGLVIVFSFSTYSVTNWESDNVKDDVVCEEIEKTESQTMSIINAQLAPKVFYDVASRFIWTITLEDLDKAKSIRDVVPKDALGTVISYDEVKVSLFDEDDNKNVIGKEGNFNSGQLGLLESLNYSSNFYVHAYYQKRNEITGEVQDEYLVYYITVVPKYEAEYLTGSENLLDYIKMNCKKHESEIEEGELKPGKVMFMVNKSGDVDNVRLMSSSGNLGLDTEIQKIINELPNEWRPARNGEGKKVSQELTISFGIIGC